MKNIICVLAVVVGMGLGCLAINNQYVKECVVVDVCDDVITIQTNEGHYFEFFGDGFVAGDNVKVTFHDNETVGITDDFIIDCEICTDQSQKICANLPLVIFCGCAIL